jgi:hypothetical protein
VRFVQIEKGTQATLVVGFAWAHCSAAPNKKAQPFRAGLRFVVGDVQETVAIRSRRLEKLTQHPNLRSNPRFHGGRDAQLHMDSHEVVPSEVQAVYGPQILPLLLAEGVGQARQGYLNLRGEMSTARNARPDLIRNDWPGK